MLTFNLKDGQSLHLPTRIEEIDKAYLKSCLGNYQIADNYAVVALVYNETIPFFNAIVSGNDSRKTDNHISLVPIFVAKGHTDNDFYNNLEERDVITINPSNLSIGEHLNFKNNDLSIGFVCNTLKASNINTLNDPRGRVKICLMEFKLVPINDIHGYFDASEDSSRTYYHIKPTDPNKVGNGKGGALIV